MDNNQFLTDNYVIFTGYAGSQSYGTSLPTSDVDIRGLFCADPINVRTPFFSVREVEDGNAEDTKFYELSHFMKLCLDCNPNIIEMLWLDESDIISSSPGYELLRSHRHSFLSSKIAFTTSGYAMAQLKRIKGHNKWITNPQSTNPPQQIDYVSLIQWFGNDKMLPREFDARKYNSNSRLIPYGGNIYGLYIDVCTPSFNTSKHAMYNKDGMLNTLFDGKRETLPSPSALVKFNKDEFKTDNEKHRNYWTWKTHRNEKRSELEEQFGYDTKHAMHLVRLMRMGKEALNTGEILVKRPDAAELLSIRNGAWTYDQVLQYAEQLDNDIRNRYYLTTQLPKKPDLHHAATVLMEIQDVIWDDRKSINTSSQDGA